MYDPCNLDLASRWEWSASRSFRLKPGERGPGTRWLGDWIASTAGLGQWRREHIASAEIRPPAVQPVARHYTD
jgi:hypothetical protein